MKRRRRITARGWLDDWQSPDCEQTVREINSIYRETDDDVLPRDPRVLTNAVTVLATLAASHEGDRGLSELRVASFRVAQALKSLLAHYRAGAEMHMEELLGLKREPGFRLRAHQKRFRLAWDAALRVEQLLEQGHTTPSVFQDVADELTGINSGDVKRWYYETLKTFNPSNRETFSKKRKTSGKTSRARKAK